MAGILKGLETLKYTFTQEELWEKSKKMALLNQHLGTEEEDKKQIMADINSRIAYNKAQMHLMSIHINNGYEMRQIETETWFNRPEPGFKTIVRLDSGEIVREVPMNPDEKQRNLPFEPVDERVTQVTTSVPLSSYKPKRGMINQNQKETPDA